MIIWILVTSLQWFGRLKILDLEHFYYHHFPPEVVTIFLIKLDIFLDISRRLGSILEFDGMSLILFTKYIGHLDIILRIVVEEHLPLQLGHVKNPILSLIGINGKLAILLDDIHMIN